MICDHGSAAGKPWNAPRRLPDFPYRPGDVVYLRGRQRSLVQGKDNDLGKSRFIYLGPVPLDSLPTGSPAIGTCRLGRLRLQTASTASSDAAVEPPEQDVVIVKQKRLLPVFQQPTATSDLLQGSHCQESTTLVLVSSDTKSYRALAESQVTPQDRVLEIGCSTGETSSIVISRNAASWVGFDNSSDMVATTLRRIKRELQRDGRGSTSTRISGQTLDLLLDPGQARDVACQFGSPTVVLVDVGGNRRLSGVARVLGWVFSNCVEPRPRLIVCKSSNLYAEMSASSLKIGHPLDQELSRGLLPGAHVWFELQLTESRRECLPKHPLQAALVLAPLSSGCPERMQPICRYHNYHEQGCAKAATNSCPYSHDYCHICVGAGHIARRCPLLFSLEKMDPE